MCFEPKSKKATISLDHEGIGSVKLLACIQPLYTLKYSRPTVIITRFSIIQAW